MVVVNTEHEPWRYLMPGMSHSWTSAWTRSLQPKSNLANLVLCLLAKSVWNACNIHNYFESLEIIKARCVKGISSCALFKNCSWLWLLFRIAQILNFSNLTAIQVHTCSWLCLEKLQSCTKAFWGKTATKIMQTGCARNLIFPSIVKIDFAFTGKPYFQGKFS